MEMHLAKRVEIIIESPLERRLTKAIEGAGVSSYTIVAVQGGAGRSGSWTADGQISPGRGMVAVIYLIRPERLDSLLDAAFDVVKPHIGVVSITDAHVLRAELF